MAYEIVFTKSVDNKDFPEASMYSHNSIVVDEDKPQIYMTGIGCVKLSVDGRDMIYNNVLYIKPYYYDEG